MSYEFEAMATATGELIYDGEVATTFSLLPSHKETTDPLTRKNMEAWTRFMDSQYDPDTLAAVTEECIDKRYSWHGKDAADGHSDDKTNHDPKDSPY